MRNERRNADGRDGARAELTNSAETSIAIIEQVGLVGVVKLLSWLRSVIGRELERDNRLLENRVRRFLEDYLAADPARKNDFYEAVAGAAAACQTSVVDPDKDNIELAQIASEKAFNVFRSRAPHRDGSDSLQFMITDAYATVAMAHRRAAATYTRDLELQRLGTAAVHLVTIATSYIALTQPEA